MEKESRMAKTFISKNNSPNNKERIRKRYERERINPKVIEAVIEEFLKTRWLRPSFAVSTGYNYLPKNNLSIRY
jgi:hypothetical protein